MLHYQGLLDQFLDQLASKEPVPGGGSVAALSGALGAALLSMVCNLTLGKEKYKEVESDINAILSRSETLRDELLKLLEADTQAYSKVAAAYRLPKATADEQVTRSAAIQRALREATDPPLQIARRCAEIVDLCLPAVEKGNVAAISDVGVGVLMAEAGLRGAALNVEINLRAIKDESFVHHTRNTLKGYLENRGARKEEVLKRVEARL
ncbi:MAG: cyclodeaminase/cyclohydrolase family protein [Chloroflexi bacterium]|nr:cyclodeaminase/cyclohydrolase family protein [Chloroflexota bacterium]MCL5075252.1 cyclodeaminase/cyclohydrolase family protein [Chloroflexota bacterium]